MSTTGHDDDDDETAVAPRFRARVIFITICLYLCSACVERFDLNSKKILSDFQMKCVGNKKLPFNNQTIAGFS